jgi:NAD(P)-dependent dehydrogenase (short-subunit alcohol dehydrogenase family)
VTTVLIIGASRGIGLETLKGALKAGYKVRALARSAGNIPVNHPNLEKVAGDALDRSTVKQALAGVAAHRARADAGTGDRMAVRRFI